MGGHGVNLSKAANHYTNGSSYWMIKQYGMRNLPNVSTHDQQWISNPRPFDCEFNMLSTRPYAPFVELNDFEEIKCRSLMK